VSGKTLLDRIWQQHVVAQQTREVPATIFIDLHLLNEVTSPQAFAMLEARGFNVSRPDLTLATIDHSTPTRFADAEGRRTYVSAAAEHQVALMAANAARWNIPFFGWEDDRRGIVHVLGPELGATLPGMTIVCGDSHTSTHGAFGALAFGIGTSEIAGVLATQCMLQRKPKSLSIAVEGALHRFATPKDLALAVVTRLGAGGGAGHVIEYRGSAIGALSMEGRMTLCNMSIEGGARAGLIAPDDTTFEWIRGRPAAPCAADWGAAERYWRTLATDPDAEFDRELVIDASSIAPSITWGTSPNTAIPIDKSVPEPTNADDKRSLNYMQFEAGRPLIGTRIDAVFIGSCTNGRLGDLRAAAQVLRGKRIAPHVFLLVVPGSEQVRKAAEEEGLDGVFIQAGGEWRVSGCSMCLGMNGDSVPPGSLVVSTSNRNFVGRQGPGVRSVLASPLTAAAAALAGAIVDPRRTIAND
jgi:3-isopropylmalate/(R)-2-methylmalate dehydratase large subunit